MKIVPMLIPPSNKFTRPGISMSPKYITIHETDNTARGANAFHHAELQKNGNDRQASWHFTVDCGDTIYQSIPTNEVAWHAGDGEGIGNLSSIAMELCVNEDGNFTKTKENALWLIKYLMDRHNIPLKHVVPHQHWSGKNCPRNILKSGWENFFSEIKGNGPVSPVDTPKPFPGVLTLEGSKGSIVKEIQGQLGGVVVDGVFGPITKARVEEFQKVHHLVIDGIVGMKTWNALFN